MIVSNLSQPIHFLRLQMFGHRRDWLKMVSGLTDGAKKWCKFGMLGDVGSSSTVSSGSGETKVADGGLASALERAQDHTPDRRLTDWGLGCWGLVI